MIASTGGRNAESQIKRYICVANAKQTVPPSLSVGQELHGESNVKTAHAVVLSRVLILVLAMTRAFSAHGQQWKHLPHARLA